LRRLRDIVFKALSLSVLQVCFLFQFDSVSLNRSRFLCFRVLPSVNAVPF
jgi:hypothetical protein